MLGVVLLALGCVACVALLINPKTGAVLVWPIVFAYPHLYMQRSGYLPWNVGVDDLFICVFFLAVVVRRNLMGGIPIRLGLTVWGALTYFLIWTMANLSGWAIMPELLPIDIVKPILKYVVFVLFAYSMVHTIDTARDLKWASVAFVFGIALGGITVILHDVFPHQMVIFTSERIALQHRWYGGAERAVGALASANIGCAVLAMVVFFAMGSTRLTATPFGKAAVLGSIPVLLVAMLLTGSRTGVAALGITLCAMAVFSRLRLYACILIIGSVALALVKPAFFLEFSERVASAYNPEAGGQLGSNVAARIDLWRAYWESSTLQVWLFGQGRYVPTVQLGMHTHSTYVAALFNHGVGGVIWMVVFFGIIVRRGLWLVKARMEPLHTLASAVLWSLLAWAVAGIGLDMLVTFTPRFVYLFYAVLIERSYALAKVSVPAELTRR